MRIAVFVDYWNLQLTLNTALGRKQKSNGLRAKVDWKNLGQVLAGAACPVLGAPPGALVYEGCYIYTSYNPATDEGKKFKHWVANWLDRQPGNNVEARERKPKTLPKCPVCYKEISHCPRQECGVPIVATAEKGVDTLLVTDLIRLAVSNSYDAAVLASSDADMIPAVQFVQTLGKKVIQAGFRGIGMDIGAECWGSFCLDDMTASILREQ